MSASSNPVPRAAGRIVGRKAAGNRWIRGTMAGLSATAASFFRTGRKMLLEIWAVFFLFFAVAGAVAGWREYHVWQAGAPAGKFLLAAAFCGVFLYLGATSLLRARR